MQSDRFLELEKNGKVHTERLVHTPAIGEEWFNSSMLAVMSGGLLANVS